MKYTAVLNGKKYEIELEKVRGNYQPISRSGEIPTEIPPVSTAAPAPVQKQAPVKAEPVVPKVSKPAASPQPATPGQEEILSPMPGNILDIKVAVGDKVSAGQTVLILEAMKMENEIMASIDGTVKSVDVAVGDKVETDALLVTIG